MVRDVEPFGSRGQRFSSFDGSDVIGSVGRDQGRQSEELVAPDVEFEHAAEVDLDTVSYAVGSASQGFQDPAHASRFDIGGEGFGSFVRLLPVTSKIAEACRERLVIFTLQGIVHECKSII